MCQRGWINIHIIYIAILCLGPKTYAFILRFLCFVFIYIENNNMQSLAIMQCWDLRIRMEFDFKCDGHPTYIVMKMVWWRQEDLCGQIYRIADLKVTNTEICTYFVRRMNGPLVLLPLLGKKNHRKEIENMTVSLSWIFFFIWRRTWVLFEKDIHPVLSAYIRTKMDQSLKDFGCARQHLLLDNIE